MAEEYDSSKKFLDSLDEYPTSPAYGYIPPTEKPLEGSYPLLGMIAAATPLGRGMKALKMLKEVSQPPPNVMNVQRGKDFDVKFRDPVDEKILLRLQQQGAKKDTGSGLVKMKSEGRSKKGVPRTRRLRGATETRLDTINEASDFIRAYEEQQGIRGPFIRDDDFFYQERIRLPQKMGMPKKSGDVFFGDGLQLPKSEVEEIMRLQRAPDLKYLKDKMKIFGVDDPRQIPLPSDLESAILKRIKPK